MSNFTAMMNATEDDLDLDLHFGSFDIAMDDLGDGKFSWQMSSADLLGPLTEKNNDRYYQLIKAARDLQKYYLIVLAAIGVPSNALTVATILSMHALSPATFFVVLLAIFDGSALAVKLIGNQLAEYDLNNHTWFCQFMDPFSISFSTTANWVLVLICLERFISVCYPLKKAYLFTKRRSYISAAILVIFLFSVIMLSLGVMRYQAAKGCTTRPRFNWFYKHVWLYINNLLYLVIPFFLIALLTGFIIYGLQKSRKHRMSLIRKGQDQGRSSEEMKVLKDGGQDGGSRPHSKDFSAPRKSRLSSTPTTPTAIHHNRMLDDTARVERTITLMLIAAAVIFLVLSLPMCVYHLLRHFKSDKTPENIEKAQWKLYQMIAFVLVDSSHAVNFFLYFFTAKRFRVQLFRIATGRAKCWGRRLSRRGGNTRTHGTRGGFGQENKCPTFASSHSTASTGLSTNGAHHSTVYMPQRASCDLDASRTE